MLGGGAVLMTISAASGELTRLDWSTVSPAAFGAWVYVAAFGSVAYGCYLWLLKASTPAKAATMGCSAVVVVGVLLVVSR